jgi:hypothetical protein
MEVNDREDSFGKCEIVNIAFSGNSFKSQFMHLFQNAEPELTVCCVH